MRKLCWRIVLILIFLISFSIMPLHAAVQNQIFFLQQEKDGRNLYAYDYLKSERRCLRSGKNLNVRSSGMHLLYTNENKLYQYDLLKDKEFLIGEFSEEIIYIDESTENFNQVTIVSASLRYELELNYYVLDFNDNDLRRISQPKDYGNSGNKITALSPNASAEARVALGLSRSGLEIKKGKEQWKLPKELTVFPERPMWSPDSKKLAFYAKNNTFANSIYEGFFSLYIVDIEQIPFGLHMVQADVFTRYSFEQLTSGGFAPMWTSDSQKLVYAYLIYGSPNESSLMEYDLNTLSSRELYKGPGKNYYPQFSPDEQSVLFVSNRYGAEHLFLMRSGKVRQISEDGDVLWCSFGK